MATRFLPESPNFGQAKHGQNGPAATFCQKGICCPVRKHHFTCWTHPDISRLFKQEQEQSKKIPFFTNFYFALVKEFVGLYSIVQPSTAQYSQVQPITAQYSPVQPSTAKYIPLQLSTAH